MRRTGTDATSRGASGFTLIELLAALAVVSLLFALVVPNLGSFVPSARLESSGLRMQRKLDWLRSEARIRGREMSMELDLDRARWRIVFPPDMRLTQDQDADTLEEWSFDWTELEPTVLFLGAGDAANGLARKGLYRIRFDEYGFSNDQLVALTLKDEPKLIWSLRLRGLTGATSVEEDTEGNEPELTMPGEGAF